MGLAIGSTQGTAISFIKHYKCPRLTKDKNGRKTRFSLISLPFIKKRELLLANAVKIAQETVITQVKLSTFQVQSTTHNYSCCGSNPNVELNTVIDSDLRATNGGTCASNLCQLVITQLECVHIVCH
jgi:hypothetical protein